MIAGDFLIKPVVFKCAGVSRSTPIFVATILAMEVTALSLVRALLRVFEVGGEDYGNVGGSHGIDVAVVGEECAELKAEVPYVAVRFEAEDVTSISIIVITITTARLAPVSCRRVPRPSPNPR